MVSNALNRTPIPLKPPKVCTKPPTIPEDPLPWPPSILYAMLRVKHHSVPFDDFKINLTGKLEPDILPFQWSRRWYATDLEVLAGIIYDPILDSWDMEALVLYHEDPVAYLSSMAFTIDKTLPFDTGLHVHVDDPWNSYVSLQVTE